MDLFKQVSKKMRANIKESGLNSRRVAENFPYVERKNDEVIYYKPYKMEFNISDHPHMVTLNVYIKPPNTCFKCNTAYQPPGANNLGAHYSNPSWPSLSGTATPAQWGTVVNNDGGFVQSAEGIIVPQDGVYTVTYTLSFAGVTTDSAGLISSVRHNGVIVSQALHSTANGKLPEAPAYIANAIILYGLCITMREEDTVNGWLAVDGFGPFIADADLTIQRVAYL